MIETLVEELKSVLKTDDISIIFSSDQNGITITSKIMGKATKHFYPYYEMNRMNAYDDLFYTILSDIKYEKTKIKRIESES